jgi:hypothetical protein
MKTFSDVKQGDTVYFLIDTCSILQEHRDGMGFANHNYGLILCQRTISSDRWEWHNPRTEAGLLFSLRIDKPIMKGSRCIFGPYTNGYGNKCDSALSISKEMGRKSCIKHSFGDYICTYDGYIFTTKEELKAMVKGTTDIVETNLKRINDDLDSLL